MLQTGVGAADIYPSASVGGGRAPRPTRQAATARHTRSHRYTLKLLHNTLAIPTTVYFRKLSILIRSLNTSCRLIIANYNGRLSLRALTIGFVVVVVRYVSSCATKLGGYCHFVSESAL